MNNIAYNFFLNGMIKYAKEKVRRRVEVFLTNDKNKVLIGKQTYPNGERKWAFPGGGIDRGETPELAGIREALEETGKSTTKPKRLRTEVTFVPPASEKVNARHKGFSKNKTYFISGKAEISEKSILGEGGDFIENPKFVEIEKAINYMKNDKAKDKNYNKMYNKRIQALNELRRKL